MAGRTLRGHRGAVFAIAVDGPRLVSASADGTIRMWLPRAGVCVVAVAACPSGPGKFVRCLAVSGGLVLGGCNDGAVRVWDSETLEPVDGPWACGVGGVRSMVAEAGEVWCCVGTEVVVWGQGRGA